MMPVSGETSLATIQSAPLALRFFLAKAMTFCVSAAKPITSCGRRPAFSPAIVLRMSGFSTSSRRGAPLPGDFLIFSSDCVATRQSATAAAKTATSAGSARRTASSISRADSMWTTSTPAGSASRVGPVTSVTRAPSAAASAAMAAPCLPDERLAM